MAQSLAELLASARGLTAALKLKTSALDAAVTDLQSWQSEAASAVKLAYRAQPEKWVEFGIKARR
jgi:hypothetical protein